MGLLRPTLRKFFKDPKAMWYIQKVLMKHNLIAAKVSYADRFIFLKDVCSDLVYPPYDKEVI